MKNNYLPLYSLILWVLAMGTAQTACARSEFQGVASYYAEKFHGRRTANGEIYNMWAMTAAHKTLPFGTMVKVTNLDNGKSVVVRINDRGPYAHNRVIDLSKKAAAELDMIKKGTAKVKVEILKEGEKMEIPTENGVPIASSPEDPFFTGKSYSLWGTEKFPEGYGLQVASYRDLNLAKGLTKEIISKGIEEVYIQVGWHKNARIYRIIVGSWPTSDAAKSEQKTFRKKGYKGFPAKHFL